MGSNERVFRPDYAVAPGETLLETIEALGITQAELALRTGRPLKTINEIIKGKTSITPETALQLERVLRVPASFWNNRERQYQEVLTRRDERNRLERQTGWAKQFPVNIMVKRGWIRRTTNAADQVQELLNYFGVATPTQWEQVWQDAWNRSHIAFRKSRAFSVDYNALAAWLRKAELQGIPLVCQPFDETRFREALKQVRQLTTQPPDSFRKTMISVCAQAGVAVVFVPELPKTRVCGATQWLSSSKALIALSLRYKSDDQLWFTFFHEAGHILLHGKKRIFVECTGSTESAAQEEQANAFSRDFLIPPADFSRIAASSLTQSNIKTWAARLGIAPGVIVGRLQHDKKLPRSYHNDLKRWFEWK